MDGEVPDPAGDPPLRQPRRRPLRPAARHHVRHPRHGCGLRRGRPALDGRHGHRRGDRRAVRDHGHRLPVGVEGAGGAGARPLPGSLVPHRALAQGGRPRQPAVVAGHRRQPRRGRRVAQRARPPPGGGRRRAGGARPGGAVRSGRLPHAATDVLPPRAAGALPARADAARGRRARTTRRCAYRGTRCRRSSRC